MVRCYEVIHVFMPRKLGGNRSCGRELCPGCPGSTGSKFSTGIKCWHCNSPISSHGWHYQNSMLSSYHFLTTVSAFNSCTKAWEPEYDTQQHARLQPSLLGMNAWLTSKMHVQYRYLIPAPVDRTSASAWLLKHSWFHVKKKV